MACKDSSCTKVHIPPLFPPNAAELELLEHGWMGSPASRGRLALAVRDLAGGQGVQGRRRLGRGGAEVELDARFQPYF